MDGQTSANATIPRGDALHAAFHEHCARQELRFQKCLRCDRWRHMPRVRCPACGSDDWAWTASSGQGIVRSWTVCHRAFHPSLEGSLPYAVALVEFEPGARLIVRLIDVDVESVAAGMTVEVCFEQLTPDHVVPRVRPLIRV